VSPGKPVTEDELVTTNKLTFFNFNKKNHYSLVYLQFFLFLCKTDTRGICQQNVDALLLRVLKARKLTIFK
jgi:hypothetical protein